MSQFYLQMTDSWIVGVGGYDQLSDAATPVQLAFNDLTDLSAAVPLTLTSTDTPIIVSSSLVATYNPAL